MVRHRVGTHKQKPPRSYEAKIVAPQRRKRTLLSKHPTYEAARLVAHDNPIRRRATYFGVYARTWIQTKKSTKVPTE